MLSNLLDLTNLQVFTFIKLKKFNDNICDRTDLLVPAPSANAGQRPKALASHISYLISKQQSPEETLSGAL